MRDKNIISIHDKNDVHLMFAVYSRLVDKTLVRWCKIHNFKPNLKLINEEILRWSIYLKKK